MQRTTRLRKVCSATGLVLVLLALTGAVWGSVLGAGDAAYSYFTTWTVPASLAGIAIQLFGIGWPVE